MPPTPELDHVLIAQGLTAFDAFTTAVGQPQAQTSIQPLVDRYRAGIYRLVLVGEEKRGKSSMVSALLGEPALLPSGTEPMTACVFKVIYGPRFQHRVFFLPKDPDDPEGSRPAPLDVSPVEVAAYGTERGNPGNVKGVDFIAVEHTHPLLKAGLTIVDLPGLGGLKQEHGLLTLSYLPNADAAFFVTDSTASALTREENVTLDRLAGFTQHLIFVQTKIDIASTEQWQSWRDRNLEEIEKRLGIPRRDILYYPVSNTIKHDYDQTGSAEDLEDSGFAPLLRLLEDDLIPRKHDRLAMPMLAALIQEVSDATQPIENEITIRTATSKEELDRMETTLREKQRTYETWKAMELPRVLSRFRDAFRNAEIETELAIERDLDPSEYGPIVGPLMASVEHQNMSAGSIAENSAMYNDSAVAACGKRLGEISEIFDQKTSAAYDRAADEIGSAADPLIIERAGYFVDLPFERVRPRTRGNLWGTVMQGRMGGLAGATVAGIVAHIVFPPLALVTGAVALLGGLFGMSRSIKDARRREGERAEQQLRSLLIDSVRRLQRGANHEFRIAAEKSRAAMHAGLNAAIEKRDQDERAALTAIADQRRRGRAETEQLLKVLHEQLEMAGQIYDCLRRAGVPLDDAEDSAAA